MKTNTVNVQTLYDLMIERKRVSPYELTAAAEGMYRNIKIVGIKHTNVQYADESGNLFFKTGTDIPIEIRAMAAFIMKLLYRWDDDNAIRLENHFGIPYALHIALEKYNVYKNNTTGIAEYISVKDIIDTIARD